MAKERVIEGWAVVNTEINEVCSFLHENAKKEPETAGKAIFTSDWEGMAKRQALEWKRKNLARFKGIKVVPIKITYHA